MYMQMNVTWPLMTSSWWKVFGHMFINPLMYSAFAIELSDLSKPFKFARLKGFERSDNSMANALYIRGLSNNKYNQSQIDCNTSEELTSRLYSDPKTTKAFLDLFN